MHRRTTDLRSRTVATVLGLCALAVAPASTAAEAGWRRVELPQAGSYALRYLPAAAAEAASPPAIVFLHGAGSAPELYPQWVEAAADEVGAVLVLPKSLASIGWGAAGDEAMIDEALAAVAAELPLDPRRTAIAGYSAGGAYAYLVAYLGARPYAAVFTMAAPYYEVPALARPGQVAPLRMYYGTLDPNFSGDRPQLVAQWQRLGVPFEEDLRPGYDHNDLPAAAVAEGFAFLAAHQLPAAPGCTPSATRLCLAGGRFRVEVDWAAGGGAGAGRVVPVVSDDSGLFWFFDPANWELLVKVLDGCAVNGHRWVFAAATTDVAYTLRVTDTENGEEWRFENPAGRPAPAVTDTAAFPCPG